MSYITSYNNFLVESNFRRGVGTTAIEATTSSVIIDLLLTDKTPEEMFYSAVSTSVSWIVIDLIFGGASKTFSYFQRDKKIPKKIFKSSQKVAELLSLIEDPVIRKQVIKKIKAIRYIEEKNPKKQIKESFVKNLAHVSLSGAVLGGIFGGAFGLLLGGPAAVPLIAFKGSVVFSVVFSVMFSVTFSSREIRKILRSKYSDIPKQVIEASIQLAKDVQEIKDPVIRKQVIKKIKKLKFEEVGYK